MSKVTSTQIARRKQAAETIIDFTPDDKKVTADDLSDALKEGIKIVGTVIALHIINRIDSNHETF
jgi:hypothetical protein